MRKIVLWTAYLTGSCAARRFCMLISGERGSRDYLLDKPEYNVCGYFYEELTGFWIAFDNRNRTLWVNYFKHEKEAREALRDGDEFFAA